MTGGMSCGSSPPPSAWRRRSPTCATAAALKRYNAFGPSALGDLRRGNGAAARVSKPELQQRLRGRLVDPPPDGGVWTSGKVARWMAGELGLASLAPQRGWKALRAIDWSIQKPRPRNPKAATPRSKRPSKTYGPPRLQGIFRDRRLISLLQRIRLRRCLPAKMEIRAPRSS